MRLHISIEDKEHIWELGHDLPFQPKISFSKKDDLFICYGQRKPRSEGLAASGFIYDFTGSADDCQLHGARPDDSRPGLSEVSLMDQARLLASGEDGIDRAGALQSLRLSCLSLPSDKAKKILLSSLVEFEQEAVEMFIRLLIRSKTQRVGGLADAKETVDFSFPDPEVLKQVLAFCHQVSETKANVD